MLLNSTERRVLWSSSTALFYPNEWNQVDTVILILFPSIVEISFLGEVEDSDSMSLKGIAIIDSTQQSRVGELQLEYSTGGMIAVSVLAVAAIPDPVFYRVQMKQTSTALPSAAVYAGTLHRAAYSIHFQDQLALFSSLLLMLCTGAGIEYEGCYSPNTMYQILVTLEDTADLSRIVPAHCGSLCTYQESQIRFSAQSKVQSARVFPLPLNGFTLEFWLYQDTSSDSVTSMAPQVVMLYGNVDASISVTLDRVFTIWKCDSSLVLPFGLPNREWTHVALAFRANSEISFFMDGQVAAVGVLNASSCEIPSSAVLQFGRGMCFQLLIYDFPVYIDISLRLRLDGDPGCQHNFTLYGRHGRGTNFITTCFPHVWTSFANSYLGLTRFAFGVAFDNQATFSTGSDPTLSSPLTWCYS